MSEPADSISVTITVNDTERTREIPARTLLSEYIREYEHLTGTHRGCESTKCGACTVLLDGDAVKSCNVLAVQADGSNITTVEGMGKDGELHPIQESFWENHGMQCGFCTPGFVMASSDLLSETEDPSLDEIQEGLAGNICRCTGYTKITESVKDASERMESE